ncbi:MAG: hypothetical protein HY855_08060 [Burkholderiales bacterium]|nr:hypothetical protein [Burkholderiales bacterium]
MSLKRLLSAALVTSSLLAAGAATAATLVTLNPSATNGLGAAGVVSGADGPFQAVGFQSNLYSTLTIGGNTGVQGFLETGYIKITSFMNSSNGVVASGVNSNYGIIGNFTLSGVGAWAGNFFNMSPVGVSMVVNLLGDPGNDGVGPMVNLGTATLASSPSPVAFAIAFGSTALGATGDALTSLSANLQLTPAPGTTGVGGFFEAPIPFNIQLAVGNAGGNSANTSYTVDATTGVVTVITPKGPGVNPGTANATFVPEPGALSLAALALIGVGVATRRKARAQA